MRVAIGSSNPVKVEGARQALEEVHRSLGIYGELQVIGVAVNSQVGDQPFSEEETHWGALNRAQAALQADQQAQLGIGLEGGVSEQEEGLFSTVWVCIADAKGRTQCVNGNRFLLPDDIAAGIRAGNEMGDVMADLTGKTNIKQQEGMIGTLTGGVITRRDAYAYLTKLAYSLWRRGLA